MPVDSVRAQRVRAAALGLTATLMVLIAVSILAHPLSLTRALLTLIATAPLGVGLWRLWARDRRAYGWMTLLVVPYLVAALTETVANPGMRAWAAAVVFTAFVLFIALIACLRETRYQDRSG